LRLETDLEGKLQIPAYVTETSLRPDLLLISDNTKQLGIVELKVPNEDRIEISSELKRANYQVIAETGKQKGWRVSI
jgi:hypothetical protein